jgi:hypothetical protein
MAFARLMVLAFAAAFFAHPAAASDPRPPQLQISFLAEPAPIVQYGSTKLVYEMVVTNFSKSRTSSTRSQPRPARRNFRFPTLGSRA